MEVLAGGLRTVRVVYWVNVSKSSGAGVTLVVPDKGPLKGCCCGSMFMVVTSLYEGAVL